MGGRLAPLGCAVFFIDLPVQEVLSRIEAIRIENNAEIRGPLAFEQAVLQLDPMEAPWTTELAADCGAWTCYINNGLGGGDSSAIAPALARYASARCVTAVHKPRHGPGHSSTQFVLHGPDGDPPLMGVRSLAAHCENGRWIWHEGGRLQPFEKPNRYLARLKRERLDRALVVEYLEGLSIEVDNEAFFGDAWVVHQQVTWPTRQESAAAFRQENGWS